MHEADGLQQQQNRFATAVVVQRFGGSIGVFFLTLFVPLYQKEDFFKSHIYLSVVPENVYSFFNPFWLVAASNAGIYVQFLDLSLLQHTWTCRSVHCSLRCSTVSGPMQLTLFCKCISEDCSLSTKQGSMQGVPTKVASVYLSLQRLLNAAVSSRL